MGRIFITSRGARLELVAVPPKLAEKLVGQYPDPTDQPYYEIKTATGTIERHLHDETTVETVEEKAALSEFRKRQADTERQRNEAVLRLILARGVKCELPETNDWIEDQKFIGLTVPDEPRERKLHWLVTEALGTIADYNQIMAGVQAESGVTEESLKQAEATFRGAVGRDSASETASENNGHELADEPAVRADARRGPKRHPGHTGV